MSSRITHSLHFAVPLAVTLALAGTAGAAGPFDGTYKGNQTGTAQQQLPRVLRSYRHRAHHPGQPFHPPMGGLRHQRRCRQ